MGNTIYGIAEMCADLGVIAVDADSDQEIIEQVLPLAEWMAKRAEVWLPSHHFEARHDSGFGTNQLTCNTDPHLTISTIAWPPGGSILPHPQEGWEIIAPIFGKVRYSYWAHPDSGTESIPHRPDLQNVVIVLPGQAVAAMPGNIQGLDNISADPNLTLHIRRRQIGRMQHSQSLSSKSPEPLASQQLVGALSKS